jgi:Protein of unknown function (DUF2911)
MKFKTLSLLVALSLTIAGSAQISTPQPSPLGTVTQKVGLTDLSITYSRPSVKGRTIFGDLVFYGEMWRWGANASTKFKTSEDISIEGHDVPAGEYALYAIPNAEMWTIVIHKNTTHWGVPDKYDATEDLIRFDVKVNNAYPVSVETMTFDIADITNQTCNIHFTWANTELNLAVKTNTDKEVMAEITRKMKGVSSATYYQAARYYLNNDKDMEKALEWINFAVAENNKFWVHRQKSLILAKLERYTDAIAAAEDSKTLAIEADNQSYVRLNDKAIDEWTKLVPMPVKN